MLTRPAPCCAASSRPAAGFGILAVLLSFGFCQTLSNGDLATAAVVVANNFIFAHCSISTIP